VRSETLTLAEHVEDFAFFPRRQFERHASVFAVRRVVGPSPVSAHSLLMVVLLVGFPPSSWVAVGLAEEPQEVSAIALSATST
jgi:hypothetical protein